MSSLNFLVIEKKGDNKLGTFLSCLELLDMKDTLSWITPYSSLLKGYWPSIVKRFLSSDVRSQGCKRGTVRIRLP